MNHPPTFGRDATPPYARSIPMIAFWKRIDAYTSRLSRRGGDLRFSAPAIGDIAIYIRAATRRQETRWNSEHWFNSDLITIASFVPLPYLCGLRSLVMATTAEVPRSWHPFLSMRLDGDALTNDARAFQRSHSFRLTALRRGALLDDY